MTAVISIALVSVSPYAFGQYNAAAALGACQADALQGLHYAINGDCPNWEARQAGHMQAARPAAGGYAAINQFINKPTFRRHTLGFLSERRRESYLEAFAAKAMTISLFVQDLPCW